jgi:hypothetical protein
METRYVMQTYCVRQGQVEVGVIEHEGREFSALGASVSGRNITGYTKLDRGRISLTTWCGKTTVASRCEVVEKYWSGSLALMFRLTNSRYIVGYSLGEGMLFRGELLTDTDDDDARRMARMISENFSDLDTEDEENFDCDE